MTLLVWDDEWQEELDAAEAELERARVVEPVSPDAADRKREHVARCERIVARLLARAAEAAS